MIYFHHEHKYLTSKLNKYSGLVPKKKKLNFEVFKSHNTTYFHFIISTLAKKYQCLDSTHFNNLILKQYPKVTQ